MKSFRVVGKLPGNGRLSELIPIESVNIELQPLSIFNSSSLAAFNGYTTIHFLLCR